MKKYTEKQNYKKAGLLLNNLNDLDGEITNILGLLSKVAPHFREEFKNLIEDILDIKIDNIIKSDEIIEVKKRFSKEANQYYFYIGLYKLNHYSNETFSGGRIWINEIKNENIEDIIVNVNYIDLIEKRRE